jgi:hypothetical protein
MTGETDREPMDFAAGRSLAALLGIAAFAALCLAAVWLVYPEARQVRSPPPAHFAPPGLRTHPAADHRARVLAQERRLAGADGRLPIGRAMARVVARGTLEPGR